MNNYKILLAYDGGRYNGFQKQKNTPNTIQSVLEKTIEKYLDEETEITGSGRTDAGVHARGQVANFKTERKLDKDFIKAINDLLPNDIAVLSVEKADLRFHSRLNAKAKTYEYTLWRAEYNNVFHKRHSFSVSSDINVEKMQEASALLLGKHDFLGFSSLKDPKKSTIRTIEKIELIEDLEKIKILYTGDGFLYNMVRIITGTLIEIGEGKREASSMEQVLKTRNRELAGFTAPACGLCLNCVYY